MRTMKSVITAILILIVLLLAGCYMDVPSESGGSVAIQLQSRALPGTDYNGSVFRVKLFVEGSVNISPLDSIDPVIDDSLYYTVLSTLPAIPFNGNPYEDFPYDGQSPDGSFVLEGVVPGRYQLVIEEYIRWAESGTMFGYYSNQRAGVSSAFEVNVGENSSTTVVLSEYFFGDSF